MRGTPERFIRELDGSAGASLACALIVLGRLARFLLGALTLLARLPLLAFTSRFVRLRIGSDCNALPPGHWPGRHATPFRWRIRHSLVLSPGSRNAGALDGMGILNHRRSSFSNPVPIVADPARALRFLATTNTGCPAAEAGLREGRA